ncbi:MAG: PAS domain-containing protein, partial [Nitrospirae bacterium]|nr:PAS domain-containing protein [Nitrospirota bacterium]
MINVKAIDVELNTVTDGDNTKEQLKEELKLSSEVMSNMAEGVILVRVVDGAIVYCNPKFEEMFGYENGELIGKDISIVNAPTEKAPEEIARDIQESLNQYKSWQGEVYNLRKDGTSFWCYATVSTFKHYKHGDVWVSIHTDISHRKMAEELRLAKEFSDSVINTAQAIILVLGRRGEIIRINPYMEEISGYTLEEVKGKDWFETFLPERDRQRISKLFVQAIGNIQIRGNVNPIVTKDGREILIEWYTKTLKDGNNEMVAPQTTVVMQPPPLFGFVGTWVVVLVVEDQPIPLEVASFLT